MDGGGVDVRVRVEIEIPQPLVSGEPGGFDPADRGAPVAVIAFGETALTVMPKRAVSFATVLVNPMMPALAAA